MSKPREFWCNEFHWKDGTITYTPCKLEDAPLENFLVREVIPIDWEKVWVEYDGKNWTQQIGKVHKDLIQDLVDRALKGEL